MQEKIYAPKISDVIDIRLDHNKGVTDGLLSVFTGVTLYLDLGTPYNNDINSGRIIVKASSDKSYIFRIIKGITEHTHMVRENNDIDIKVTTGTLNEDNILNGFLCVLVDEIEANGKRDNAAFAQPLSNKMHKKDIEIIDIIKNKDYLSMVDPELDNVPAELIRNFNGRALRLVYIYMEMGE